MLLFFVNFYLLTKIQLKLVLSLSRYFQVASNEGAREIREHSHHGYMLQGHHGIISSHPHHIKHILITQKYIIAPKTRRRESVKRVDKLVRYQAHESPRSLPTGSLLLLFIQRTYFTLLLYTYTLALIPIIIITIIITIIIIIIIVIIIVNTFKFEEK